MTPAEVWVAETTPALAVTLLAVVEGVWRINWRWGEPGLFRGDRDPGWFDTGRLVGMVLAAYAVVATVPVPWPR